MRRSLRWSPLKTECKSTAIVIFLNYRRKPNNTKSITTVDLRCNGAFVKCYYCKKFNSPRLAPKRLEFDFENHDYLDPFVYIFLESNGTPNYHNSCRTFKFIFVLRIYCFVKTFYKRTTQ